LLGLKVGLPRRASRIAEVPIKTHAPTRNSVSPRTGIIVGANFEGDVAAAN